MALLEQKRMSHFMTNLIIFPKRLIKLKKTNCTMIYKVILVQYKVGHLV